MERIAASAHGIGLCALLKDRYRMYQETVSETQMSLIIWSGRACGITQRDRSSANNGLGRRHRENRA